MRILFWIPLGNHDTGVIYLQICPFFLWIIVTHTKMRKDMKNTKRT